MLQQVNIVPMNIQGNFGKRNDLTKNSARDCHLRLFSRDGWPWALLLGLEGYIGPRHIGQLLVTGLQTKP